MKEGEVAMNEHEFRTGKPSHKARPGELWRAKDGQVVNINQILPGGKYWVVRTMHGHVCDAPFMCVERYLVEKTDARSQR
jgi:hypothetical protein